MLVVDRIAAYVENLLLEIDEFIFELDLVHRTIVGLFCVLFHAVKIRHEDAKERQRMRLNYKSYAYSPFWLTNALAILYAVWKSCFPGNKPKHWKLIDECLVRSIANPFLDVEGPDDA